MSKRSILCSAFAVVGTAFSAWIAWPDDVGRVAFFSFLCGISIGLSILLYILDDVNRMYAEIVQVLRKET